MTEIAVLEMHARPQDIAPTRTNASKMALSGVSGHPGQFRFLLRRS